MEQVRNNAELNLIKLEKRGFILNDRPDEKKVHHVTCESVTALTVTHPKYFSQNRAASREWLDSTYGERGWRNCGFCNGLDSSRG